MATKKILVVFGATGGQGGSVVKSMLSDPKMTSSWKIRGITRDPSKPSAKALEAQGVETVAADLNDKASLKKALHGAYAVFAVTNYWEKMSVEIEVGQGKAIADAAKEEGIQHLVWSSLMNVTKLSKGVLPNVYHFDSKAQVEEYIRSIGIPATFFMPGYFMSNVPGGALRKMGPTFGMGLPIPTNSPIPMFNAQGDAGKFVKGILLNREKLLGERIYGATEYLTVEEIVKQFSEVFPEDGKDAKAIELPHEAFLSALEAKGMPKFVQEELLENMRLMAEFGYYGGASLDESHSILVDKLTTWKEFCKAAKAFEGLK
ncbi:hypothetical protein BP6252_07131 [Coleophoma cylindrospora]|uniref:NmrA-like family domain-containing protein 1 n=1 Tax=Coleophoma cylindrospora TaxID=1849047 RepID=A0A3D8RH58_9HELO|nr:hypothetical protein BP6252_07131 [Coleophoma cylindrospora]